MVQFINFVKILSIIGADVSVILVGLSING